MIAAMKEVSVSEAIAAGAMKSRVLAYLSSSVDQTVGGSELVAHNYKEWEVLRLIWEILGALAVLCVVADLPMFTNRS